MHICMYTYIYACIRYSTYVYDIACISYYMSLTLPERTTSVIARTTVSVGVRGSGRWQNNRSTYDNCSRANELSIPSSICFFDKPFSFTPVPHQKSCDISYSIRLVLNNNTYSQPTHTHIIYIYITHGEHIIIILK